jgi:hypothetical protein
MVPVITTVYSPRSYLPVSRRFRENFSLPHIAQVGGKTAWENP